MKLQQFIFSLEGKGEPAYLLEMCVSDHGGEFRDQDLQDFLAFRGISHMTAPGNTPNFSPLESRMKGLMYVKASWV